MILCVPGVSLLGDFKMVHGLEILAVLNALAEKREQFAKYEAGCGAEKCCGNPSSCDTRRRVVSDLIEPGDECLIDGKRAKKVGCFFDGPSIFEFEDGSSVTLSADTLVTPVDAEPVGYSPLDRDQLSQLVGDCLYHPTIILSEGGSVATRLVTEHVGDSVYVGGQWVTAEELCRMWFLDSECKQPVGVLV